MAPCRGVIGEHCADDKAAKKCFHVLAMSLEALSAIRRRCQDMEALFSGFHIGAVGVGLVGGYRGCQFGRLVVSWMCGGSEGGVVDVVARDTKEHKKSPIYGLVVTPISSCFSLDGFQPVHSPSRVARQGGACGREIEPKGTKNRKERGSQTPYIVARAFFCRLDQSIGRQCGRLCRRVVGARV